MAGAAGRRVDCQKRSVDVIREVGDELATHIVRRSNAASSEAIPFTSTSSDVFEVSGDREPFWSLDAVDAVNIVFKLFENDGEDAIDR